MLTETIFNLTGVGKTVFDAISARDYAVVQGFTLVIAVAFVIVNLVDRHPLHVPRSAGPRAVSDQVEAIVAPDPAGGRRRAAHAASRGSVAHDAARDAAQAVGGHRARHPRPARADGGLRPGPRPVRAPRGLPERRRPAAQRAVLAPARLRRGRPAAHPRHRRQRPRRAVPPDLRRPHLDAGRHRVGHPGGAHRRRPRADRRLLRTMVGQRDHAVHGRAARVPRPAARHHHRHRARARGCSTPSSPSPS